MPAAMTYNSLVSDLEAYLQRTDELVVNQIPGFIMLAQQRIPRELKILGFRTEVAGQFSGDTLTTGIMPKPSDWRKTIAFYVGTGSGNNTHSPIFERTYETIRTIYPDPTIRGTPKYYADADFSHWLIGPSPLALPYKIAYYGTLVFLDTQNTTNWLTQSAPDLLLYACLCEAIPFLKTDERIPVWQGMYVNAKQALITQELEGLYDTAQIVGNPQPSPPPGR